MDTVTEPKKKKPTNLWKPGQSGNPAGRPKGAKSKATELRQALEVIALTGLESASKELIRNSIEMALDGNEAMMKFWLERFVPKAVLGEKGESQGGGNIIINVSRLEDIKEVKGEVVDEAEEG